MYHSLGSPPSNLHLLPKWGEKKTNTARYIPYIRWMVILWGHNVKKIDFENLDFELPKVQNCMRRLCSNAVVANAPPPTCP